MRFILNFAEITKHISNLLKKDWGFKWNDESKKAFKQIKEAIVTTLVLVSNMNGIQTLFII
jgi:hypothetical protein